MKQRMRGLSKKLELITYKNDKVASFCLSYKTDEKQQKITIEIPVPIMFRYYHIGRAYDLHQLKSLHPNSGSRFSIDYISTQLLIQEIEQVSELIADPVLIHYGTLLVNYLKSEQTETKKSLIVQIAS